MSDDYYYDPTAESGYVPPSDEQVDNWDLQGSPLFVADPRANSGLVNYDPTDPYANTYYDPSVAGPGADISGPSMSYDPNTGINTLYDPSTGQTFGSFKSGQYNDPTSGKSKIGGSLASAKKLISGFMDKDGNIDFMKALLGLAAIKSMSDERGRQQQARGYQGSIPKLTATRTQIPQSAYVPYSGQAVMGSKQLSDVVYTPSAAEGGIMGLAAGGLRDGAFIIPADVVSHFGNGSSEAGLEFLAKKLGATPIKGKGDGMSDSIDTTIEGQRPAKVAHEEAIVSPEKVKALGKGDPKKGAKVLYAMMDRVRKARTGTKKQGKQINPEKFTPGGIAGYAGGGAVAFNGTTGSTVTAPTTGSSTTSNLSEWAGPYASDMLGKAQGLANQEYQAYTGPLTAGYSPLQQKAFEAYGNMPKYTPTSFSGYSAPKDYTTGRFDAGFKYDPTNFDKAYYQAPTAYQAGQFDTGLGAVGSVESYMNPYMQNVVDIQAREARRQADIDRLGIASRLTSAGAYGGSRQAILEAEQRRNLQQQIGDIQAKGSQSAFENAQARQLAVSKANMEAQAANEASRQYAYGNRMTAAQLQAQFGLDADKAKALENQFKSKTMADFQMEQQKAAEASRQFGYGKKLEAADAAARYGLEAQKAAEAANQFQAKIGLESLMQQLEAGKVQRDIEQQGIAAKQAEFEKQRLYPYQQLQFQQSMLQGMPINTYSNVPQTTGMQDLSTLLRQIYGIGQSETGTTTQ